MMTLRRGVVMAALAAASWALPAQRAGASGVVAPEVMALGAQQLSAEWWQLVYSLPPSVNGVLDETGDRCMIGQRGPVWFLYGTFSGTATRHCTVPAGKAIFFPIVNVSNVSTGETAAELRVPVASCMDAVRDQRLVIDGKVQRLDWRRFRVRSTVFEITVPADNVLGIEAGTFAPAIDEGFYVMLAGLSEGEHTITFGATQGTCPFYEKPFRIEVTYQLTVVRPRPYVVEPAAAAP